MSQLPNPRIEKQLVEGLAATLKKMQDDLMRVHVSASVLVTDEPLSDIAKSYSYSLRAVADAASEISGAVRDIEKRLANIIAAYK